MLKLNRHVLGTAIVLSCICVVSSVARGDDTASGNDNLWKTDFTAAKAQAKAEKKLLLLDFTGSDWCGWCKKLKAEVFSKEHFTTEAPKRFVLVELDFPKKKKLAEDLAKQNRKLAAKYKVRGYPTILVVDAEGHLVAHTGYRPGGPEAYVKQLDEFVVVYASITKMKDELAGAKGLDRAKLLDKIVGAYDKLGNDTDEVAGLSKEIVSLDADNKAGLRSKYEFKLLIAQSKSLQMSRKFADAKAALDKAVTLQGVSASQKDSAYLLEAEICYMQKDYKGLVKCMEESVTTNPSSPQAGSFKATIAKFKPMAEAQELIASLKVEAEKASGLDRAKVLDKLVDTLPKLGPLTKDPARAQEIEKLKKDIIALDSDNKAGLKTKYELHDLVTEAAGFVKSKDADKAQAALEKARALPGLNDQQKAMIEKSSKDVQDLKAKS